MDEFECYCSHSSFLTKLRFSDADHVPGSLYGYQRLVLRGKGLGPGTEIRLGVPRKEIAGINELSLALGHLGCYSSLRKAYESKTVPFLCIERRLDGLMAKKRAPGSGRHTRRCLYAGGCRRTRASCSSRYREAAPRCGRRRARRKDCQWFVAPKTRAEEMRVHALRLLSTSMAVCITLMYYTMTVTAGSFQAYLHDLARPVALVQYFFRPCRAGSLRCP